MKYKVIECASAKFLAEEVDKELEKGNTLQGGVSVVTDNHGRFYFYQAILIK